MKRVHSMTKDELFEELKTVKERKREIKACIKEQLKQKINGAKEYSKFTSMAFALKKNKIYNLG